MGQVDDKRKKKMQKKSSKGISRRYKLSIILLDHIPSASHGTTLKFDLRYKLPLNLPSIHANA
jgi:hypothetical protein